MRRRHILAFIGAGALLVMLVSPFVGMEYISPRALLSGEAGALNSDIFWKIRLPRTITAFVAGAALALGGAIFQALFRNPLATPYTLGVSSGAAFGAAVSVTLGAGVAVAGMAGQTVGAFLGALTALGIVYGLTWLRRGVSTAAMLLAGVAVNFFFASGIMFLQYVGDIGRTYRTLRWMMGGFEFAGYGPLTVMVPFVLMGTLAAAVFARDLNLLALGDDIAISRGVDTRLARTVLFVAVSLMIAGIVSVAGPIGFVGMMAPHICRMLVGHDNRASLPASLAFGGALLALCDTLARIIAAPAEIPVGVITSLLGGPFFLWLLLRKSSSDGIT